jgi:16S rRNA processing protein RimM
VRVARIAGAHGLGGELRIDLLGADAECLDGVETLWLARDESDPDASCHALLRVARGRAGECRVALAGIATRDAAEALRGRWLLVRAGDLPAPAPGEYYVHELVGCRVEDAAGQPLGVVQAIWSTGGADVLIVADAQGRELLLPAVSALLLAVDVAARRIAIDAIPGLIERPGDGEPEGGRERPGSGEPEGGDGPEGRA